MSQSPGPKREERVLGFEEARALVLEHARSLPTSRGKESVQLLDSLGRTLAADISADRDFPPFPRAARDGYAVRSDDLKHTPASLNFVGEVRAGGDLPAGFTRLQTGQALAIMTGAPVPDGADSVVMVEYTERSGRSVTVKRGISAGENVVPRGSEAQAGSVLVAGGTVISHAQVALAAAVGLSQMEVYRRPRVAILPTGDEIVPISEQPKHNQIRNSNSYSLAAQVIASGGEPWQLRIAPDNASRLRELIAQGLDADLLLLSGGVSAGEYDLVEDVLAEFSPEFIFTGVQMQPGKPLVFGRSKAKPSSERWTYFFGLPGNPISTMVTFALFARTMLRALSGAAVQDEKGRLARLAKAVRVKTGLTRFLPARIVGEWKQPEVEIVKWQGSGDVAAFGQADCLLVVPPDREEFAAGELMLVERL